MSYRFDAKEDAAEFPRTPFRPRPTRSLSYSYLSQPLPTSPFETVLKVVLCILAAMMFTAIAVIVICFALVLCRSFVTDLPKAVGIIWPEICVAARWIGEVVTPRKTVSALGEFWHNVGEEEFWKRVGTFTEAFSVLAILLALPASGLFILCVKLMHMVWSRQADKQRRNYFRERGVELPY